MYQYTTTTFKGDYNSNVEFVGFAKSDFYFNTTGGNRTVIIGFGVRNSPSIIHPTEDLFSIPGIPSPSEPGYNLSAAFNITNLHTQVRAFRDQVCSE